MLAFRARAGKRRKLPSVLLAGISAFLGVSKADAAPICRPPSSVLQFNNALPQLANALTSEQSIRIVAFGSSSTRGTGASGWDKTYPQIMLGRLKEQFPTKLIEVHNRGNGGELASHMLARLESDVLSIRPHLVIWQTGVNDAIRRVQPASFRQTVEAGLAKLADDKVDVVLLDQQLYPGASEIPDYPRFLQALHEIGANFGVPVFGRYELMDHLVKSSQFTIDELLAADRFHQNDVSYRCLGVALADALSVAIAQPTDVNRSSVSAPLRSSDGTLTVDNPVPDLIGAQN